MEIIWKYALDYVEHSMETWDPDGPLFHGKPLH